MGSGSTHSGRNRPTRFWGTSWVWPPNWNCSGGTPTGFRSPLDWGFIWKVRTGPELTGTFA